ncbi:hypothetical protein COU76_05875 [Candidatus Peregrinibacteria bacterium CG10_big_fil_rev_8_21_14_0_10_49_10]|nr:MAG: hypothetical protein COU76_05875 [Candidatus Peregrinibacteria bacterium CG10_big_fil_rev_8_21_14_0_10_49_10]
MRCVLFCLQNKTMPWNARNHRVCVKNLPQRMDRELAVVTNALFKDGGHKERSICIAIRKKRDGWALRYGRSNSM